MSDLVKRDDLQALSALTEEFAKNSKAPSTLRHYEYLFNQFNAWCELNGETSLPAEEQTILRFLHSNYEHWSSSHMNSFINAIKHHHITNGKQDPAKAKVATYLGAVKREKGITKEKQKIDPIRGIDAKTIVKTKTSNNALETRTAVILQTNTPLTLPEIRSLRKENIKEYAGSFKVETDKTYFIKSDQLNEKEILAEALKKPTLFDENISYRNFYEKTLRTVKRANVNYSTSKQIKQEDAVWIMRFAEKGYQFTARNTAYMLTGLFMARRHNELANFEDTDFRKSDGGYDVLIKKSKTDQEQQGTWHRLDHLENEDSTCPVCALEKWWEVKQKININTPITFPSLSARGKYGHLTAFAGREILKKMWDQSGMGEARIGTRSLRVGAATSMVENGASTLEVAEITKHKNLAVVQAYIRRTDPFGTQYHILQKSSRKSGSFARTKYPTNSER